MKSPNITTSSLVNECSICEGTIAPGTPFLDQDTYYPTAICKACVEHAALKFNPQTPDAWGRTGQLL
tara:strand:- start:2547 stop:2747 length:201 start_codon:yes stop_codon:yes gene_type:complete